MEKKLNEFIVGEFGIVKKVLGEGRVRRRLFDMGITPGAEFYLRKKAPLGDPIEVTLRGYELTLRKDEAEHEYLEKLDNILNILDNLNAQEQYFIKGTYFHERSESAIRDKLQVSKNGMDHVKQSAIIKFALAFNLAEEKENRK